MIERTAILLNDGTFLPLATAKNKHHWKNNTITRKPAIGENYSPGVITIGQQLEGYFTFRLTPATAPHLFRLIAGNHLDTIHVPETKSLYKETRYMGNPPQFTLMVEEHDRTFLLNDITVTAFELVCNNPSPLHLKLHFQGDTNIINVPYTEIPSPEKHAFFFLVEPVMQTLILEGSLKESPTITLKTSDEVTTDKLTITAKAPKEYEPNRGGLFELRIDYFILKQELITDETYLYEGIRVNEVNTYYSV